MKSKWHLVTSFFQIVIGTLAVAAYIVLAVGKEAIGRWTVTLILAVAFIVMGVIGVVDYMLGDKK